MAEQAPVSGEYASDLVPIDWKEKYFQLEAYLKHCSKKKWCVVKVWEQQSWCTDLIKFSQESQP